MLWISGILVLLVIAGLLPIVLHNLNKVIPPASDTVAKSPAVTSQQRAETPTVVSSPGLVVSGKVTDRNGAGIENVSIYRSYASYSGEVIATTDGNGIYASVFYPIPGDENVTIWAQKLGLSFEPENYRWRHYYGFEQAECSFQEKVP